MLWWWFFVATLVLLLVPLSNRVKQMHSASVVVATAHLQVLPSSLAGIAKDFGYARRRRQAQAQYGNDDDFVFDEPGTTRRSWLLVERIVCEHLRAFHLNAFKSLESNSL
jgi:hypothetical protein